MNWINVGEFNKTHSHLKFLDKNNQIIEGDGDGCLSQLAQVVGDELLVIPEYLVDVYPVRIFNGLLSGTYVSILNSRLRGGMLELDYVFMCSEKHGLVYYDISDIQKFRSVVLNILLNRFSLGYYEPIDKPKPFVKCNDVSVLTDDLSDYYHESMYLHDRAMDGYKMSVSSYNHVLKILKDKNYLAAMDFLISRSNFQYEKVGIVKLSREDGLFRLNAFNFGDYLNEEA